MKDKNGKNVKIAALILAAGNGKRFGGDTPKQFLMIDETPMLLYSVDAILPHVDRLLVVAKAEEIGRTEEILNEAGLLSSVGVVSGGKERYESSLFGLRALAEEESYDFVMIHDAARCLVTEEIVRSVIEGMVSYGPVVAAIPAKDTIKIADGNGDGAIPLVCETPDRRRCFQVQTPQGFPFGFLVGCYEKAVYEGTIGSATDDASVVEKTSEIPVGIVPGSEENFKVTTPFDFMMAETVLTIRRLRKNAEKPSCGNDASVDK